MQAGSAAPGASCTLPLMRVVRMIASALLAILLLGGVVGTAIGVGAPRPSCAALKGKRLKGAGSVRVVVTRVQIEGESQPIANVCASAHARAWPLGVLEGVQETQVSLAASAGQWVALRFVGSLGIASLEVGKAVNARTGQKFTYWHSGMGPSNGEPDEVLESLQLNELGQLAYAVGVGTTGTPTPTTRKIVGVETGGRRKTLDSAPAAQIPSASLKLSGSAVQWLDAGTARSASL
jgi:hypothetical protein